MSKLTVLIIQVCVYHREQEGCDGSQGSQLYLSYIIFTDKMVQPCFKDIWSPYCKKTNNRQNCHLYSLHHEMQLAITNFLETKSKHQTKRI